MNINKVEDISRRNIAILFIVFGLIIGIVGGYGCMAVRYYEGVISANDSRASQLIKMYPVYSPGIYGWDRNGRVIENAGELAYNITDTRDLEGLPYTTYSWLSWIPISLGIFFILSGVMGIYNQDYLFMIKKVVFRK